MRPTKMISLLLVVVILATSLPVPAAQADPPPPSPSALLRENLKAWSDFPAPAPVVSKAPSKLALASPLATEAVSQAYNGGRIVFVSGREGSTPGYGDHQIYAMDPDGSNQVNLSANGFRDTSPVISPNGQRIAFVSTRDGNQEVYLMDIDGGSQTRLTNTPGNEHEISWAPDGTRLVTAYQDSTDNNRWKLTIINVDTRARTVILESPESDTIAQPDWSPVSETIAFFYGAAGSDGINTIPAAGGEPTFTELYRSQPRWSPDGTRLAFTHLELQGGTSAAIGIVPWPYDRETHTVTWITPLRQGVVSAHARWSPDGRRIIYDSIYMGFHQLYMAMADGSTADDYLNISASDATDMLPDWRAIGGAAPAVHGPYVAYQSGNVNSQTIYIYNGLSNSTTTAVQGRDLRLGGIWGQWVAYQKGNQYGGYDIWVYDMATGQSQRVSTPSRTATQNRPFIDGPLVIWRQMSASDSAVSGRFYAYDLVQRTTTYLNVGSYNPVTGRDYGPYYSRYTVGDGRLAFIDEYAKVRLFDLGIGATPTTSVNQYPKLLGGVSGNMVAALERSTNGNDLAVTYTISPTERSEWYSGVEGPPSLAGDTLLWTAASSLYRQDLVEDAAPSLVSAGVSAAAQSQALVAWLNASGAWSSSQAEAVDFYSSLPRAEGDLTFRLPMTTTLQLHSIGGIEGTTSPWERGWLAKVVSGRVSLVVRYKSGRIATTMFLGVNEYIYPGYELYSSPYEKATLQFRDGSTLEILGGTYLQVRAHHPTSFQTIQSLIGQVFQTADMAKFQQAVESYARDGSTSGYDENGQPTGVNLVGVGNDLVTINHLANLLAQQARNGQQSYIARGLKVPTYLNITTSMLEHTQGSSERIYNILNYVQAILSAWKVVYYPWYENAIYDAFRDYFDNIVARAYTEQNGQVVYYPLDPDSPSYQNRVEVLFKMILHDGRTCFYEKNWQARFFEDGSMLFSSPSCGTLQWSRQDIVKHIAAADGEVLRSKLLFPLIRNSLQLYQDVVGIFAPGEAQLILSVMTFNQVPQQVSLPRGRIQYLQDVDRVRQRTPRRHDFPGARVLIWGTAFEATVNADGSGTVFAEDGMPVLASTIVNAPDAYGIRARDGHISSQGSAISVASADEPSLLDIPGRLEGKRPLLISLTPNESTAIPAAGFHFKLGFTAPMSSTAVTNLGTLTVTNASGETYYTGSLAALPHAWDMLSATLTLTPTVAPAPGTYSLSLNLPPSVVSLGGYSVAGTPPFTATFNVVGGIGAEGGEVSTRSGARLTVPPSALGGSTPLEIRPTTVFSVTSGWVSPEGMAYTFGPAGQTFGQPATIRLPLDRWREGTALFRWNGTGWENLGGSQGLDGQSVYTTTTHLSTYTAFYPAPTPKVFLPLVFRSRGP